MNALILTGIVLGGGMVAVDRYLYQLPDWLATVLYAIAAIMIIAGMFKSRQQA
jgi:hypothetical protein